MEFFIRVLNNRYLQPLLKHISRRFDLGWYPSMTAAFFRIDQLVNAPGVKYNPGVLSSATSGAHLPLIANVRMPIGVHMVLSKLFAKMKTEGFEAAKASFVYAMPCLYPPQTSLTRIIRRIYPDLQMRDLWVTTGGPELNSDFCYFVLKDIIDEFRSWSEDSGFMQTLGQVKKSEIYGVKATYACATDAAGSEPMTMVFDDPVMWSGVAIRFQHGDNRIALHYREERDGKGVIYPHICDCTLDSAVEMLDAFMLNWNARAARRSA